MTDSKRAIISHLVHAESVYEGSRDKRAARHLWIDLFVPRRGLDAGWPFVWRNLSKSADYVPGHFNTSSIVVTAIG